MLPDLDRFPERPEWRRERTALEVWQEEGYEPIDDMEDADEDSC